MLPISDCKLAKPLRMLALVLFTHIYLIAEESILTEPRVIVEAKQLKADSEGLTQVSLGQEVPLAEHGWDVLSRTVAGLNISSSGAGSYGTLVALRGVSNTPYFSDPAVSVYFGDIPLASGFTTPTSLLGFTSASVFRGPQQESVFGRAAEGGVIVMNQNQGLSHAGGDSLFSVGNYSQRSGQVDAWTGNYGSSSATVSAGYVARAGYITNTQIGKRVDNQEESSVSAVTRWKPISSAEISLQLLELRNRSGAQPLIPINGPLFSVSRPVEGVTDINSFGAALKGIFQTQQGKFTTVTSYTTWGMDPYSNYIILPPALNSTIHQEQKTWNEELHYLFISTSQLRAQLGAWFSDAKTSEYLVRTIYTYIPYQTTSYTIDSKTSAVFGQCVYTFVKGWDLTGGIRIESNRKDFSRAELIPNPALGLTTSGIYRATLPKLELKHQVDPDTNMSISLSNGAKPGGFSGFTEVLNLSPFSAESTTAFEAGIDHSINHGEFTVALRTYDYLIKNYQIERSFSVPAYIVANAPKARSIGFELELSYRFASAWTLFSTFGLTNITLTQFKDPLTSVNYSGNRAPYAPAYNGNLALSYRPKEGWFWGVDTSATGKTYYNEQQTALYAQKAYMLLNAKVGYTTARYDVFLYGNNLTSVHYYGLIIPGVGHAVPGTPAIYGAQISIKY
jgi:iron complex outermembrane recepter protein